MKLSPRDFVLLAIFLLVTVGGGLWIGVSNPPGEWYQALAKPGFTPPNWLFPIAWTVLYVFIAVAGWLVYRKGPAAGVMLWLVQLGLNFAWSPTFFGAHRIEAGFAIILALLAAILVFVAVAFRRNRAASILFLPYAVWVAYAAALNGSIALLN
ncbi:TspO/MBR family protein [Aureimonas psammosilenae]|uniref:TspO/MBR family protein n=1 Tax=Aureimonas psammosilenae TaxID=2495496 RepID=UPI001261250D|nr:TspO/MBR family protein [Aureimonas psammosilenae]